jgi:hypothetical protein
LEKQKLQDERLMTDPFPYVAIREVTDKEIRLIEVTYAGTHEKAPCWKD